MMCLLSLAVGTIGGLGAWLFRLLIGVLHNAFPWMLLLFMDDNNTGPESQKVSGAAASPARRAPICAADGGATSRSSARSTSWRN